MLTHVELVCCDCLNLCWISDESDSCGSSWPLMSEMAFLILHGESSRSDSDEAYFGSGICFDDDTGCCVLP